MSTWGFDPGVTRWGPPSATFQPDSLLRSNLPACNMLLALLCPLLPGLTSPRPLVGRVVPVRQLGAPVTPASDMRLPGRQIAVVTTAALPWMTGTSVNPCLRAGTMATKGYDVTLLLPWLEAQVQPAVFPSGFSFERPEEQAAYLRDWLSRRANIDASSLKIRWYPATYEAFHGSIVQRGDVDITQCIPAAERDVVILEEPEHLNWYHHGKRWTDEYAHVVGVGHTNYPHYAQFEERDSGPGDIPPERRAALITGFNNLVRARPTHVVTTRCTNPLHDAPTTTLAPSYRCYPTHDNKPFVATQVCAAYTDVVVQLSATLPPVPGHCRVCNVHGVRSEFLDIGRAVARSNAVRARTVITA